MHRWLSLIILLLGFSVLLGQPPHATAGPADEVVVLTIDGAITPAVAQYIERGISEAERDQVAAVVIKINTPGGLDTAMRAIIQRILTSRVPVITYVSPAGGRAASAGTFISYAAHVAAMAPSTTIGSASPVSVGQDGQERTTSDTMKAKVTNDAVSYIRGLAERRGRNADWAERAVRDAANLPASEAHSQGVVDLLATDLPDLLRQADGRTVQLETERVTLRTAEAAPRTLGSSWAESFLQLISDPTIAYLLLSLGMLGLYFEFANPGSIVPGVAGAIALVVGLFGLGTLPVNWAGVLLMVLAFILFGFDLFAPTHGALTIGGLVAFLLGSLLLFNSSAAAAFQIAPSAILAMVLGLGSLSLSVMLAVWRDRRRRPQTGGESLIGATAVARTDLTPSGMVFVEGERWQAHSAGGPIRAGTSVQIVERHGLQLVVTPAAATVPTAAPTGATVGERPATPGA